ncbi:nitrate reductase cytochrome c-type subunit [Seohaeicola zhoushanensis]|uniref:Periplasmic nitrate reductase, electron transfer subunit n=1 Tax=Seohaeicola zhoushanensis TaxID=1569283 RepID=A0A8J3MB79_9RHOB|nr:nitrate reductase cytochrome c-type subunit [Seohaeicola zhoushanensis]GHF74129.1 periplasmic nitrate reductase, electron transfer subunit [Seohaeicola zhoushanensis]
MKLSVFAVITAVGLSLAMGGLVTAQSTAPVKALRGAGVDSELPPPGFPSQDEGRQVRNYRQQPPIIPHPIDNYQIDRRTNQCLSCHDWTNAGDRGAPTLSMTHYLDRAGNQLDTVAGTRWFCNQCHVPQADTPSLVGNTFRPSGQSN